MKFVAIDLGASGTRYVNENGQICELPNNMVFLPDMNQSRMVPDANDIESCLEVQITKVDGPACEYLPVNALIGIMAERHPDVKERPSVNTPKCLQRINYVSAITSAALSRIKYGIEEDIDLFLAVPPIQIHSARDKFNSNMLGKYKVIFPKYMGGTEVTVNIVSVNVEEESVMALTSFFFNMNGTVKESAKKYMTGTVLSLDIGASSTDLSITKAGRYLDRSAQTYMWGGNEARGALSDGVRERYTIDLPVEDAERTMAEGRLQLGNTYADVSDIVMSAKVSLAKKIYTHLQEYFKKIDIPVQTINAIVVSGGGSMQSQYINQDGEVIKTSEPMSYFVTQELTQWSPGTEVVEYGADARFANIKGLFIKAKLTSLKKQQSGNVTNNTPAPEPALAQPELNVINVETSANDKDTTADTQSDESEVNLIGAELS